MFTTSGVKSFLGSDLLVTAETLDFVDFALFPVSLFNLFTLPWVTSLVGSSLLHWLGLDFPTTFFPFCSLWIDLLHSPSQVISLFFSLF